MTIREQNDQLMKDEAFVKRFEEAESPEEIVALYKEKGIEITADNAKAGFDFMHETDELDEAALDKVVGGNQTDFARFATVATAAAITIGVVAVGTAALGAAAVAAGAVVASVGAVPPPGPHHHGPHHYGPHPYGPHR